MSKFIEIPGLSEKVEIIRTKRKTLAVTVSEGGHVAARAPLKMPESKIISFIHEKRGWIEKYIAKEKHLSSELEAAEPFTENEIEEMAKRALEIIPERVKHYASLIGVTYGDIVIRNQKGQWGSCKSSGDLKFNCLLVMTPPEVLDSVVVHELCHRLHMDHSARFYTEVYKAFPEYDKWNGWLKENGQLLVRRMGNAKLKSWK